MAPKRSKNQLRREKLKQRKLEKQAEEPDKSVNVEEPKTGPNSTTISIQIDDDPLYEQFQSVLNKFNNPQEIEITKQESTEDSKDLVYQNGDSSENELDDEDSSDENDEETQKQQQQLSKRQLRIQNKIPLAKLKSSVKSPQVVEWYDVDSKDPYLLIAMKSQPNIIPVPSHWSSKRNYLSSRRGIEKLPYQLPKYIQATGISEMRSGGRDHRTLRQQQREKVQPKMGKLDMDYEKLYQAFSKFQIKPRVFPYGELFEEGKHSNDELVTKAAKIKPGIISLEMRLALSMPQNDGTIPPAWVTIMRDIGKPPSYKDLVIPGLDIKYSNAGYKDRNSDSRREKLKHWGALNTAIESSDGEDDEEDDDGQDEESSVATDSIEVNTTFYPLEEDEVSEEPSLNDILAGLSSANDKPKEEKKLYKIIEERKVTDDDSLTGYTYDLKNDSVEEYSENEDSRNSEDTKNSEEKPEDFKF